MLATKTTTEIRGWDAWFFVWETKEENLERIHILLFLSVTLSPYIFFSASPTGSFPKTNPQSSISVHFHPPCPGPDHVITNSYLISSESSSFHFCSMLVMYPLHSRDSNLLKA